MCRCKQVSDRLGRWHARAGRDHGRWTSSRHRRAGWNRRRGLSRTRTARVQVRTLKGEVGAAEASLIRGVHNDAEISNESGRVFLSGQIQVDVAIAYQCQHEQSSRVFRVWGITSQKSWVQSYFHACQTDRQPRTCRARRDCTSGFQWHRTDPSGSQQKCSSSQRWGIYGCDTLWRNHQLRVAYPKKNMEILTKGTTHGRKSRN